MISLNRFFNQFVFILIRIRKQSLEVKKTIQVKAILILTKLSFYRVLIRFIEESSRVEINSHDATGVFLVRNRVVQGKVLNFKHQESNHASLP